MKFETQNTQPTHFTNHYIHNIQPNDIVYEESEADFIERCPHDKENPYVVINVEILRNSTISPACRWLICYLLSNEKGWRINRRQVANHVKDFLGRDRTDHLFEEAINAGYMKRIDILVKRKKGGALRRCKYYISEIPKFKNSFQHTRIQGSGAESTGNTCDKVITSKEVSSPSINITPPLPKVSREEKPLPKKESLRSEEEEVIATYKKLDETTLSPNEKKRICKKYTEPEVERAVDIAKTQPIKKTYMGLLLNILDNPDQWESPSQKTQPGAKECEIDLSKAIKLANEFNEKIKQVKENIIQVKTYTDNKILTIDLHKVADKNDKTIVGKNNMCIINDGYISTVSLKSFDFEQDIKNAIAQLG